MSTSNPFAPFDQGHVLAAFGQPLPQPGDAVWVHFDDWAGRRRHAAVMVKLNPKRSRIRYTEDTGPNNYSGKAGDEVLVPNYAITRREA